jgi:hypothetical protein
MTTPNQKLESAQAKMAEAQLEINEAKRQIEEEENKPWEPIGSGTYSTTGSGDIIQPSCCKDERRVNGTLFKSRTQAAEALKRMRFYNRLCQLAMELNPSGEVGGHCYVIFEGDEWEDGKRLDVAGTDSVFETREAAAKACDIMNRDQWTLPWK